MWDLTHFSYNDDDFMKGNEYHFDNNLPSLDVGPIANPAYLKPHNIFTLSILNGLDYDIEYNNHLKIEKYLHQRLKLLYLK